MSKISLTILLILGCATVFFISSTPLVYHVSTYMDTSNMKSDEPLDPAYISFSGEWYGEKGSWILIRLDGIAEFQSIKSGLHKGRVRIKGNLISIGSGSHGKILKIRLAPFIHEGYWQMQLDDEFYYRESNLTIATRATQLQSIHDS